MRNIRHLALSLLACVALAGMLGLSSSIAWARAGTIDEFSIPTASSEPFGITAGPDGNLWFTEESANKIGRITPKGAITASDEFFIPTASSVPFGITAGPDGNLWFTEAGGNNIGQLR